MEDVFSKLGSDEYLLFFTRALIMLAQKNKIKTHF